MSMYGNNTFQKGTSPTSHLRYYILYSALGHDEIDNHAKRKIYVYFYPVILFHSETMAAKSHLHICSTYKASSEPGNLTTFSIDHELTCCTTPHPATTDHGLDPSGGWCHSRPSGIAWQNFFLQSVGGHFVKMVLKCSWRFQNLDHA